ncbi:MAG: hypothetical protein ACTSWN_13510 [Promethearchaeota archaeon]
MAENSYTLKGCLLNGTFDLDKDDRLRIKTFDSIVRTKMAPETSNTIGVCFGAAMIDINNISSFREDCPIMYYLIWLINQEERWHFLLTNYIFDCSFVIITYNDKIHQRPEKVIEYLNETREKCRDPTFGLIIHDPDMQWDYKYWSKFLKDESELKMRKYEVFEDFIIGIFTSRLNNPDLVNVLIISSLDEIHELDFVEPPERPLSVHKQISKSLLTALKSEGFHFVDDRFLIFENNEYLFKFDSETLDLFVIQANCKTCKSFDVLAEGCFTKLCIELKSPITSRTIDKYRQGIDLTIPDLFFLSVLYSIVNDELPDSIRNQFPEKPACKTS